MSEVILDTITGKSTATTITIGSTPVVSASANSMTIRGEGSNQTSIQQGLAKHWSQTDNFGNIDDSFNLGSLTDVGTGQSRLTVTNNFSSTSNSSPAGQSYRRDDEFDNSISQTDASTHTTATVSISNRYMNTNAYLDVHSTGDIQVTVHGDLA